MTYYLHITVQTVFVNLWLFRISSSSNLPDKNKTKNNFLNSNLQQRNKIKQIWPQLFQKLADETKGLFKYPTFQSILNLIKLNSVKNLLR
jgi:hypothetical protein